MQEGIRFAENLTPEEVEVDQYGHAAALQLKSSRRERRVSDAREVNSGGRGYAAEHRLGREDPDNVFLDGRWFQAVDEDGQSGQAGTLRETDRRPGADVHSQRWPGISFFGDLHPSFAGNVVKAMASAKQGYPVVSRLLGRRAPADPKPAELLDRLNDELRAVVHDVIRLTPNIVEVVVKAPMAARAFKPGSSTGCRITKPLPPGRTEPRWRWKVSH